MHNAQVLMQSPCLAPPPPPARSAIYHDVRDAIEQFRNAMRAAGLTPPDEIIADGKLHRFSSNGERGDDAGYYVLHQDGIPAGMFGDWRSGIEQTWRQDLGRKLTFPEVEALKRKADAARKQRKAEQARERAEAAGKAKALWKRAQPVGEDHPHLVRKGVSPVATLREIQAGTASEILGYPPKARGEPLSGRLLVAPIKIGGEWSSAELIDESGRKSAIAGGAKAGGYWATGLLPDGDGSGLTLHIAEGVATALSIAQAVGGVALAALSCGNLERVARSMRERYPQARIIICGDLGNGQQDAEEAARAVGGLLALPGFGPSRPEGASDFNDLSQHARMDAVRRCLEGAKAPEAPSANAAAPDKQSPQPATPLAPASDLGPAEWPEPAPLPAELLSVEAFAFELLPDVLRPWIADVGERVQCPPEFPAVAAVVALGSVLGRRLAILPKRQDNWYEYANLWGAIIGRPGVLKSPALHEALRPLRELERGAAEAHAAEVDTWKRRKTEAGIRREANKANARKAAIKGSAFDVSEIIADDAEEEPALRRYVVNDASIEALGEVLRGNPSGTLVYQDELISLLRLLEREGNEAARGFYLTAWNGKEGYTFDRIGRGLNRRVEGVCLSLLGSIQPYVIGEYLREATAGGGADGLAARFSLMVWPDVSSEWRNVDRFPNSAARDAATATFRRFDALAPESIGAERPFDDVWALRFTDAAQADFDAWREGFERTQRASEEHAAIVTHREKYRKLVPAVALICHLADEPNGGRIGQRSLLRALAWLDYLDSHAKRAYASVMRADADGARELLKRIRRRELAGRFRLRDVYRNGWARISDPEQARRAARMLVDFDYLMEAPEVTGGRPTVAYGVNPKVYR